MSFCIDWLLTTRCVFCYIKILSGSVLLLALPWLLLERTSTDLLTFQPNLHLSLIVALQLQPQI